MLGYGHMLSCRNIFKELGILPLESQYLFPLLQWKTWGFHSGDYEEFCLP
jgi:hypothetical protein